MAATSDSRTATPPPASELADRIRTAGFVQLVHRADGAALAAAGVLAHVCTARNTPFHVRTVRTPTDLEDGLPEHTDDTARILLGIGPSTGTHPCRVAVDVARALEAPIDPILALAGIRAGDGTPHAIAPTLLEDAALERTPGIAAPTRQPSEAVAHTTYASTAVSGRPEAAEAFLAEHGIHDDASADQRALASALALKTVEDPAISDRAIEMIEDALRPYAIDGPFATLAGYGDVLSALAHRAPGLGVAIAVGDPAPDSAMAVWREWAVDTHTGVHDAELSRTGECCIAETSGPVEPVARLLRDFRTPAPIVLAVRDGRVGVAAREPNIRVRLASATEAVGGSFHARGARGYARIDPDQQTAFVDAFVEAA